MLHRLRSATVAVLLVVLFPLLLPSSAPAVGGTSGYPSRGEETRAVTEKAIAEGAIGVAVRADGSVLVRLPRGRSAPLRSMPAETAIRASQFSAESLDSLSKYLASGAWFPDAQRFPYAFYYDAATDTIVVQTGAPSASTLSLRQQHPREITIRAEAVSRLSGARTLDGAPHYGAAQLFDGISTCTAAFTIRVGSTNYGMTANHCYQPGVDITSGPYYYGRVVNRPPYPAYDFTEIGGSSYAGRIYSGSATTNKSIRVSSAASACVGCSNLYFSGQSSGEVGGLRVTALNGSLCDADGCTYALVVTTGPQRPINGDSGCPLFAKASDGSAQIRGLLSGSTTTGSTGYWENWGTIAAHYGATIVTG